MEHRVLIHAPSGKDARLIAQVLRQAGLVCHVCENPGELILELTRGAGGIFIADEALTPELLMPFTQYLENQAVWSDLPILVLTKQGADFPEIQNVFQKLGNVTLLERPIRPVTLISAANSALRARKRQYEMREIDRRKDEFLAMLAHELRNPLAPISSASDLLKIDNLDRDRARKSCDIISRQVYHMTGLIDDLLDVSRVSRGLVTLEQGMLDARQIVTHSVEQVRPLIDSRRHRLTVQTPPETAIIHGDEKRLVQVITNLLTNAAKYTPEGGSIGLTMDVESNHVIFSVIDTGIGMDSKIIDKVFEMFVQAERTSDRSQGGLGIGLALVKSLVQLHGGTVSAHSAGTNQGSKFVVTFPCVPVPASLSDKSRELGKVPPAKRRRLLVVDDNVDAAQMLGMFLETAGHDVFVEHVAKSGLERARTVVPDVCLLDIGLPDMDGTEMAKRLRASPETAKTILVAITGYGQERDRERTAEAGFHHHLVKPVDMARLFEILAASDREH
jgi:signal transduction histidine kinase/ActR/RegA family two-component response regulator